jgi:hypothetical protein
MLPELGETNTTWAPAPRMACQGFVSSTCSKPSVAKKAIRFPVSGFFIFCLDVWGWKLEITGAGKQANPVPATWVRAI